MVVGFIAVSILFSFVNSILIFCTGRLLRYPVRRVKCLLGGLIAGLFAFVSMFLENNLIYKCYFIVLPLLALVGFGFSRGGIVPAVVYILLALSLGGARVSGKGVFSLLFGTIGIFVVLYIAQNKSELVPVEINCSEEKIKLKALVDSGNLLQDPVTGNSVLLVGADIARIITGLSPIQLQNPIDNIHALQGARLVPYSTIGDHGKFLLAKKMHNVRIGSWRGSILVAFCPEQFCSEGKYQALIGGRL